MDKKYITANQLLSDSFKLGAAVFQSGFRPDLIIGIWRGGTPVAIAVHEYFKYMGHATDHIAIRAISYSDIAKRHDNVEVIGLEYVQKNNMYTNLLIIDDVFDTGNSFKTTLNLIREIKSDFTVKIASPWYKPVNNQTDLLPDYFIHQTDQWLVFPHELEGLSIDEIEMFKSDIFQIMTETN